MRICERLAGRAVSVGAIEKQDAEVYAYSYRMLFMTALLWLSAILIGLIFRQLWGMLLFMVYFIPLREFAGGIHVKSRLLCYTGTILVFVLVAGAAHMPHIQGLCNILLALLPVSSGLLFLLAPQEDENKPASAGEHRHFKKMARIILVAEIVLIVAVALFVKAPAIGYFCLCGLHLCALLVTIKAVHRKCRKS